MLLIPHPSYKMSARLMNNFHLSLSLRVVRSLHRGIVYPKGFSTELPVVMWKDTHSELLLYGKELAEESLARKLPDPKDHSWIKDELCCRGTGSVSPWWLGNDDLHSHHRGIMHAADQAFYTSMFVRTKLGIRFADQPDYLAIKPSPLREGWHRINHGQ